MSEATVDPGKSKGMVGMILAIVSLVLGWWLGAFLGAMIHPWVGFIVWMALPVVAIIMSAGAKKASAAAGHNNGMAQAGFIIGIVSAAVNLILVIMAIMAMSYVSSNMSDFENIDWENVQSTDDLLNM